ncbi:MAG: 6-carboxytetrahydropterin synthase QueD [Desulfobacterales bacterium]|jgi:6-pyruvoyltetrahydropterin/6-carboxytetrahydropterin synthase|nr:6-carboxytetrahydropterin synthase QueD [Desulfobacterales bacterium]
MYELKVITRFAAAHRLTMVGTKCENMHGHNWKIEVVLQGDRLDSAGVLMDFGDVKALLRGIIARLDHQFLNELPMFEGGQPSSERIATFVADQLQQALDVPTVRVSRVSAWESEDACATWVATESSSG